jgi:hypothetical protein
MRSRAVLVKRAWLEMRHLEATLVIDRPLPPMISSPIFFAITLLALALSFRKFFRRD